MKDFKFQTNSTAIIFYYENSADKKICSQIRLRVMKILCSIYIENDFLLEVNTDFKICRQKTFKISYIGLIKFNGKFCSSTLGFTSTTIFLNG